MKKSQIALGLLQGVGTVHLVVYPVLLIMLPFTFGAASEPGGRRDLVLLLLTLATPLVWACLWIASWLLLRRGLTILAIVVSTPPAVATVGGALYYTLGTKLDRAQSDEERRQRLGAAAAENPVAADLLAVLDDPKAWPRVRQTLQTAEPALLSKPIALYGSPLRMALPDTNPLTSAYASKDYQEAARILLARGAHLTPDEELHEPNLVWAADMLRRGITLPDAAAAQENPLVWRIVAYPMGRLEFDDQQTIVLLARTQPHLLHKETRAYGTPLRAAFLCDFDSLASGLIREGALLSPKEHSIPSVRHQLTQFLAQPLYSSEKETYARNLERRGAPATALGASAKSSGSRKGSNPR